MNWPTISKLTKLDLSMQDGYKLSKISVLDQKWTLRSNLKFEDKIYQNCVSRNSFFVIQNYKSAMQSSSDVVWDNILSVSNKFLSWKSHDYSKKGITPLWITGISNFPGVLKVHFQKPRNFSNTACYDFLVVKGTNGIIWNNNILDSIRTGLHVLLYILYDQEGTLHVSFRPLDIIYLLHTIF